MNISVGAQSDVGRVREGNEDSYLVHEPLFVVADGMGGHLAGDVASSTAVDVILNNSDTASASDPQSLAELIRSANAAIWEKATNDPSLRGMGTTCTLVLLNENRAHIAHVGDSRAYLLRDGSLRQVTEDHTLVARMVKEGRLQPEEAEHHPQRSIITRALGVDADVEVDLDSLDLQAGDRLLLCSDGLSGMIDHSSIESALQDHDDPQDAAEELIRRANAAGGEDNITVVIIDVSDGPAQAASAATTRRAPAQAPRETRTDDEPGPEHAEPTTAEGPARRTWAKPVIASLIVLAALAVGAFFLVDYLRTSSWYVGLNSDDDVTIYQGRQEDLFGIDLDEEIEVTDLNVNDLPEHLRDNVQDGRTADSRDDAEQIVADLEQRARELDEIRAGNDPGANPGGGDGGNNDGGGGNTGGNNN
ncbi:MAG: Stp1/IreP family PP2C-type Ser/Thr phosphatase [Actinomycetota bacterium]|nr:Stp1/IreP family PP2C-type Ser/Thr phosphatase [Actinomycetota bacterium]